MKNKQILFIIGLAILSIFSGFMIFYLTKAKGMRLAQIFQQDSQYCALEGETCLINSDCCSGMYCAAGSRTCKTLASRPSPSPADCVTCTEGTKAFECCHPDGCVVRFDAPPIYGAPCCGADCSGSCKPSSPGTCCWIGNIDCNCQGLTLVDL